jgi:hypothetical protein
VATEKDVKNIMRDLAKVYPERVRDVGPEGWEAMCGIYWEVLRDIPSELLQTAARQCMASLKFYPKPAELREQALELVMFTLGIPNANDAWAEVTKRLQNNFRCRVIDGKIYLEVTGMIAESELGGFQARTPTEADWSTPLIQRAIEGVGGWAALRASENTVADRSQFLRAYDAYAMRELQSARLLPETRRAVLDWRAQHEQRGIPIELSSGKPPQIEED